MREMGLVLTRPARRSALHGLMRWWWSQSGRWLPAVQGRDRVEGAAVAGDGLAGSCQTGRAKGEPARRTWAEPGGAGDDDDAGESPAVPEKTGTLRSRPFRWKTNGQSRNGLWDTARWLHEL